MRNIKIIPFLSKKEQSLVEFCNKSNIKLVKSENSDDPTYTITIPRHFHDEMEKNIVKYYKDHGIKYTFLVDTEGNHHYDFDRFIGTNERFPDLQPTVRIKSNPNIK